MIHDSLDWQKEEARLMTTIHKLNTHDFFIAMQIITAIRRSIAQLSRAEVNARRNKTTRIISEKLNEINGLIDTLDAELIFPLLRGK